MNNRVDYDMNFDDAAANFIIAARQLRYSVQGDEQGNLLIAQAFDAVLMERLSVRSYVIEYLNDLSDAQPKEREDDNLD